MTATKGADIWYVTESEAVLPGRLDQTGPFAASGCGRALCRPDLASCSGQPLSAAALAAPSGRALGWDALVERGERRGGRMCGSAANPSRVVLDDESEGVLQRRRVRSTPSKGLRCGDTKRTAARGGRPTV